MFGQLEELARERRALDAREAAWLKNVAAYDRSDEWRGDGCLNAASAIRAACRMDQGVARGHVELARKLDALPLVADAYGRGEISQRHAAVVASAYTPERAAEIANVEAELVDAARECTPKELGGIIRYLTDAIDGDGDAAAHAVEYERRACYMATTLNGAFDMRANGDHLSGQFIEAAVSAEMERDLQDHDSRRSPQRRFDALNNVCRLYLDRGQAGESHGIRPHVTAVVDVDELAGAPPGRWSTYARRTVAMVTPR